MNWIVSAKSQKEPGVFYWTGGVSKKLPLFSDDKIHGYRYGNEVYANKIADQLKVDPVFDGLHEFKVIPVE